MDIMDTLWTLFDDMTMKGNSKACGMKDELYYSSYFIFLAQKNNII